MHACYPAGVTCPSSLPAESPCVWLSLHACVRASRYAAETSIVEEDEREDRAAAEDIDELPRSETPHQGRQRRSAQRLMHSPWLRY